MSKSRFTVIDGKVIKANEKLEQEYIEQLYLKALGRKLTLLMGQKNWTENRDNISRAVFYAIKYYGLKSVDIKHSREPRTCQEVQSDFALLESIKMIMAQLTPREFMQMFPITKEYDGKKWQSKDYFYTIKELKNYDMDAPLGEDRLEDFLWDYWNDDLFKFSSTAFSIISNMYRIQNNGKGIMEQWAEKNGIGTVTIREKEGYMIDGNGKIHNLLKKSKFEVVK